MAYPYDDEMMNGEDIPDDQNQDESSPPKSDWPPNTIWDEQSNSWKVLPPPQSDLEIDRYQHLGINANSKTPGKYDHTWGYGNSKREKDHLNPWGDTKEDQWLKSVYEAQGWEFPERCPDGKWDFRTQRCVSVTESPTTDDSTVATTGDYKQPSYRYYGTDPNQDWNIDQSWIRDAPEFKFDFEPWVAPEDFTWPGYEPPAPYERPEDFSYAPFIGPTAEEVLTEDPSYQFRLDEGRRLLEASAASRGTLRGGAVQKGLMDYGQESASQEWQNVWARDLEAHEANQRAAADAYAVNLRAGQWGYETNLGAGERAYGLQRGNALENAILNRDSAFNAYTTNWNNRYAVAQDQYAPGVASWSRQQTAAQQAAKARFDRQWDAYKYSQPSGSEVFQAGLDLTRSVPGRNAQTPR
jgi:hypothetical protein